jgi:hypothetical protein
MRASFILWQRMTTLLFAAVLVLPLSPLFAQSNVPPIPVLISEEYGTTMSEGATAIPESPAPISETTTTSQAIDTTPPTTPTNLHATVLGPTSALISWDASMDDMGIKRYRVYRNGVLVGNVSTLSFSDIFLTAGTTYSYTVEARDTAGNASEKSTAVQITTPTTASGFTPSYSAATFAISDRVQVSSGPLNVRTLPDTTGIVVGKQPTAALGTVAGGPTTQNGYVWWNIHFDSGADGWSVQNYLMRSAAPSFVAPISSMGQATALTVGAPVTTSDAVNVRQVASLQGTLVAIANRGTRGNVVSGPVASDGFEWWKVEYSTGKIGWTAGNWLTVQQGS